MCGIFGITVRELPDDMPRLVVSAARQLFLLSESRGKEAAGVAILSQGTIRVYKEATCASKMIRGKRFRRLFREALGGNGREANGKAPFAIVGHSRLVTQGLQTVHANNQPVIAAGLVGVHNGIIVNDAALWEKFPTLERQCQVDTEVILNLIAKFAAEEGSLVRGVQEAFRHLEGSASIAVLSEHSSDLLLATNTGSLYLCTSRDGRICIFASERYILQELLKKRFLHRRLGEPVISQVEPGSGRVVSLLDLRVQPFRFDEPPQALAAPAAEARHRIVDISARDEAARQSLRRCTRCILPETMPFVAFDDEGVCNYCRTYRKMEVKGHDALEKALARYRRKSGEADCIVAFSGGRDSSYCIHYLKRILGMHPIAYTYDWGMITDLGRRNQARITGQLGIEQILISADTKKKRKNVRKNIHAWLRKPDLGMVPLFMAGDKPFFYYANRLRKRLGIELVIFGGNPLEKTAFKSGFCGVDEGMGRVFHTMSFVNTLKLSGYYMRQFLRNPAYFNSSLLDSMFAYFSSFLISQDYLMFYDYIRWNEDEIVSTLVDDYDWETAPDTSTTWRIGDGTAAFYNYIYYTLAGLTENDTFRSNQVREGDLTRDDALRIARRDNQPRFDSIQWYARQIGFDCDEALRIINAAPKRYET